MKIFFIGVTGFGLRCFSSIKEMGFDIVGCAYTHDAIKVRRRPEGIKNSNFVDFKEICEANQINSVFYSKEAEEAFEDEIAALAPDLIVVAGWHYIIRPRLLKVPKLGVIGLHSSMLPKYRGGSPLTWQIINGEKTAGISLFYIVEGVDSGEIIAQAAFDIDDDDSIKTLIGKSEIAGVSLLRKYLPLIEDGTAPRIKQDEQGATHFPQRIPDDGEIDWSKSPKEIRNFIRAQTKPYPGAFTYINGKKVIIWDAEVVEE